MCVRARIGRSKILTAGAIMALPEIGIEVPLNELYDGLAFEATDEVEAG